MVKNQGFPLWFIEKVIVCRADDVVNKLVDIIKHAVSGEEIYINRIKIYGQVE